MVAWEPGLGAVVTRLDEPATATGALTGTALGVKDLVAVRGAPRLLGAPGLADPAPRAADAEVVRRLRAAGTEVVATTAMHALAFGVITPGVANPRCPDRIAGGSSGGSAAALAAGIVDLALGTDTGGSIRIPAACCGVVGLKPTTGAVPLDGVQPLSPSLDTLGPMARSVAEVARGLDVLLGTSASDRRDEAACAVWRVGVPRGVAEGPMDPEVRDGWQRALGWLSEAGHEVVQVATPDLHEAGIAAGTVLAAEAAEVYADVLQQRPEVIPDDVRRRLEYGRDVAPAGVAEARQVGLAGRTSLAATFAQVDVLVLPTLPCRVPRAGVDTVDVGGTAQRVTGALARYTGPWNLFGVPAGSVPCGRDRDGGPMGLQVVGPWREDRRVLAVMAELERLAGGPWPVQPVPTPPGSPFVHSPGRR